MRQRKNKTTKFVSKDILIIVIFTYLSFVIQKEKELKIVLYLKKIMIYILLIVKKILSIKLNLT